MVVDKEVTTVRKISDFYYGEIIPAQHSVNSESEYAKKSLKLLMLCDTLEKELSADDKKLLNDITDTHEKLSETMVAESYAQGFRDCAELIIDVMFGRSENLK